MELQFKWVWKMRHWPIWFSIIWTHTIVSVPLAFRIRSRPSRRSAYKTFSCYDRNNNQLPVRAKNSSLRSTMSSLTELAITQTSASFDDRMDHLPPEEPSSGKRKRRDPDTDVSEQPDDVTERGQRSGGGSRGGKRFRRVSGSSGGVHQNGTDNHISQGPQEMERWKKHLTYKRSQSFSSRDPLGLESTSALSPPSFLSNGHASRSTTGQVRRGGGNGNSGGGGGGHQWPRTSPHKASKDRVIHPPRVIMCPDPLQLEVKIQAYEASHRRPAHQTLTKREEQAERFRYGNYNRYYGYRQVATDPRYPLMRREWVEKRECLDVGCNTGQLTLALTKDFEPRMMVGVDVDAALIRVAKRNVRHYLTEDVCRREGFPKSLPILYGPIAAPVLVEGDVDGQSRDFPCNIAFLQCDYVPQDDGECQRETEEFDTIFALSITKWIHLNHGDQGLKRFFRRTFRHLRPGGILLLEPQEWKSYSNARNKGKLTAYMKSVYEGITLMPDDFQAYLLSSEVGFQSCEKIELPSETSVTAGFKRCLFVYKKSTLSLPPSSHTETAPPKS